MKIHTFIHTIVGITAMWMIRQHRGKGATPRGFQEILKALHEKLFISETFKKTRVAQDDDMFDLADYDHLRRFLSTQLLSIPEFLELNLRDVEWNIGLRAKDVEDNEKRNERLKKARVPMGAYRYGKNNQIKPEYEFIDLDALIRNICVSVVDDQVQDVTKQTVNQN